MSFDFQPFCRLLYQDALEDAIQMLKKTGSESYHEVADRISSQHSAWLKSAHWKPFSHVKKSKYHEIIVRNLYRNGLAASKDEVPPGIESIHPWRRLLLSYGVTIIVLCASLFFFTYKPACPAFEAGKEINIIIDNFESYHQPLLQKIGIDGISFENHIKRKLSGNASVTIHPVHVNNRADAKARCESCGANMLIWGEVDYMGEGKANLNHYLANENYESYILSHGIPTAEESYKGIFDLRTKMWIGDVTCLINLFEGLMAKDRFEKATDDKERQEAIHEADRLFDELSICAKDDSLKLFALQCLAWAKVSQHEDAAALVTYNKILSIDSGNVLALNNSALLYQRQDNYLYANLRYEKLLEKNDVPYLRLANAGTLKKLNRAADADREIEQVKKSSDYKGEKVLYDQKIKIIETSAYVPKGNMTTLAPSAYLSSVATLFNAGDTKGTINGLDSLTTKMDTATFTQEDILIMKELYKNTGATKSAKQFNAKAQEIGVVVPAQSVFISKAVKKEKIEK